MKRFIWLVAAMAFVIALPGSNQVTAAKKKKAALCHNGHVIFVAQAAVPAHLAHGDCRAKPLAPGAKCDCGGGPGPGDEEDPR